MKAIVFDTETTDLISNGLVRTRPFIIEFYGCLVNLKNGKVSKEFHSFVKPPDPKLVTPKITKITNIEYDRDLADAPTIGDVWPNVRALLESKSDAIIAHNLSYDMEMIEIEQARLSDVKPLKWPVFKCCTVEQTVHLLGYRMSLQVLHEYLFGEKFLEAHRANKDTEALVRCAMELHKREII